MSSIEGLGIRLKYGGLFSTIYDPSSDIASVEFAGK